MVQPNDRGVHFRLDMERAYTLNARIPSRISLMWYETDSESAPDLHAGQRWRMAVRLHRPHGNANADGSEFKAWLPERGIRAVGYIRAQPAPIWSSRWFGAMAICWKGRARQRASTCSMRWEAGPMRV